MVLPPIKQRAVVPPKPPFIVAYEPYDEGDYDEPVFDQVHIADIQEWPVFDETPWRFDTCKLESCTLMGTKNLRVWDSTVVRCDLSGAKFFDSGVLRSEFLGCRFTGAQFGESMIEDITFQNCKLNMISFRKCKLERVIFQNCILDDTDFNLARMTDVTFVQCELMRTDFSGSHSMRVDLSGSDLCNIRGVTSLRNVRVSSEQMIQLAPLLCAEIGIQSV